MGLDIFQLKMSENQSFHLLSPLKKVRCQKPPLTMGGYGVCQKPIEYAGTILRERCWGGERVFWVSSASLPDSCNIKVFDSEIRALNMNGGEASLLAIQVHRWNNAKQCAFMQLQRKKGRASP